MLAHVRAAEAIIMPAFLRSNRADAAAMVNTIEEAVEAVPIDEFHFAVQYGDTVCV